MQNRNLTYSAVSGVIWSFLGVVGQGVAQIIILVILARLLTPEDFGLVGIALIVISFFNIICELGIGSAIIQRVNLENRHTQAGFTLSLLMSLILSVTAWFLAPLIASFFRTEKLSCVLKTMLIILPLHSLSLISASLLQREFKFRTLALVEIISYLVGFGVCGVILAVLKLGVWALVGAYLCQSLFYAIILLTIRRKFLKLLFDFKACKELMRFGIGFTIAEIANYFAGQGDNVITGKFLGAQALGIYGRAYQLMAMPATLFGGVIDRVLFSVMAKIQYEPQQLVRVYRHSLVLVALLTLPLSIAIFILAPEFIFALLGPQWKEVVIPFQILCLGMFFRTSYKMSESLARALGAVYRRAWRQWVYALFIFIGAGIGSQLGVSGIAVGVLIAIIINFFLMVHLSLKLIKMSMGNFIKVHSGSLYLSLVLGILILLVKMACIVLGLSSVATLLISFFIGISAGIFVCLYLPYIFLGEEGRRLILVLIEKMPPWIGKNMLSSRLI